MRWPLTIALLLLGGCALPLSGGGIFGGLAEEQVSAGTYRIVVPAAVPGDPTSAQDRVLLRAAETAKRVGGTHVMVLRGGDVPPAGPLPASAGGRPYAAYVKVITLEPGQPPPSGALNVEEVLHFFARRDQTAPGITLDATPAGKS